MLSLLKKMFGRGKAPQPSSTPVNGQKDTALAATASPVSKSGTPLPANGSRTSPLSRTPAPGDAAAAPVATLTPATGSSLLAPPQVAVAQLSLAAIISKFPDDLRENIARMPDAQVTVALPLATIHKQLQSGIVKMSLASLFRQAPQGTFVQTHVEGKRMVEVPISEILRHVDMQALRQRSAQRRVELPKGAPGLFGDKSNPFAIAPMMDEDEGEEDLDDVPMMPPPAMAAPLSMPGLPAIVPAAASDPGLRPLNQRHEPPVLGEITLRLGDLSGAWPEAIRSEVADLSETEVTLPAALLGAGLSRGRVPVTWGQIRSGMSPAAEHPTTADEATELLLPLKVVAPAFLAHTRPTRRRSIELDESIPTLFGNTSTPESTIAPVESEEPVLAEPSEEAPAAEDPPAPAPTLFAPLAFRLAEEPAAVEEVTPTPTPTLAIATPAPAAVPAAATSQTLGELFGEPDKTHWSVQEIVAGSLRIPGIAGAVVALQEGLLVAAQLPPEMKGDTVAAFLPQIFARLNHYMGEMTVPAVDDVCLNSNGTLFHAWRMGEVYYAVFGQPGVPLPEEALHLVVQELRAQAPK